VLDKTAWEAYGQQLRDSRWGRLDPVPNRLIRPKKKMRWNPLRGVLCQAVGRLGILAKVF